MVNLGPWVPHEGNVICEFKGGPFDKLGLRFFDDNLPKLVTLDGHSYTLAIKSMPHGVDEEPDEEQFEIHATMLYVEEVEEREVQFDYEYHYQGKDPNKPEY